MPWALVVFHVLLPLLVGLTAGAGSWRCWRLLRYGSDRRLAMLAWFYGLLALSVVPLVFWTARVAADIEAEPFGSLHAAFARSQPVDALLLAHHFLLLASLAVATFAFSQGHRPGKKNIVSALFVAALAAPDLPGFLPVLLGLEAILTLHLAIRALANHAHRKTPGALRVATGFSLLFVGQLSYFVFYAPEAARSPVGDAFALAGLVVLVRLLPRPAA